VSKLTRHEEQLRVGKEQVELGAVKATKTTETAHVCELVPRAVEEAELERVAAPDGDSGEIETLPDGSVSIPLFEEQLVVTKRLVVRERVIVRKHTTTDMHEIEAELRRERIEIDTTGEVELDQHTTHDQSTNSTTDTR
jgi:uncharacterized protein (TIGR02271 family)